jgi:hypothetical protein
MTTNIGRSSEIRTASTLAWLWGVLLLLISSAILMPLIIQEQNFTIPLLLLTLGIAQCLSGYLLRKQLWYSGWVALVTSLLSIFTVLQIRAAISILGLALSIFVIILVLRNRGLIMAKQRAPNQAL